MSDFKRVTQLVMIEEEIDDNGKVINRRSTSRGICDDEIKAVLYGKPFNLIDEIGKLGKNLNQQNVTNEPLCPVAQI